jgi:polysaccharide export outer membrane protein
MNRSSAVFFLLCFLPLVAAGSLAQLPGAPEAVRGSAEVRIELPQGTAPRVSVSPGARQVLVDLPRGAVFPLDLSGSSGGLLRGGEVTALDEDRVQLRLDLALGLLDRVVYEPSRVVLFFESRFDVSRDGGAAEDSYRLGPDDKLLITVHNHPELTSRPTVTGEGTITAPLVGDVDAAGLGPRELAVQLSELLGRSYLVDPQVDVEVEEFRSQWVMVTGEVQMPQRVFLHGGTRLKEVLSEAGGFSEGAGERITISRRKQDSDGYESLVVERSEFETGATDPRVRHGDIVEVSRAEYCYLQGEVRQPGRVRVERGMTLLKAISLVGGLTEWADRKAVRILYEPGTVPREGIFNVKQIQTGKEEDPVLSGGEVVVVKRRFF